MLATNSTPEVLLILSSLKKMLTSSLKTRLRDMKVALPGPSDPEMGAPKVRVDVTETYMADKETLADLLDEFWGLLQSVLSRRAFLLSFGVGFWKSWAAWLESYVPMVVPVGHK
jgi:hypothetical protein